MRRILFKLEAGEKEGQETAETKLKKYDDYKKLLEKDGEVIVKEEMTKMKRIGPVMAIYLK